MRQGKNRANSLGRKRWIRFKKNRRGFYSFILFALLFGISLFAEVLSNDKPLLVRYDSQLYFPLWQMYPETVFGGDFDTETDYRDPYILERLTTGANFVVFPPNPHSFNSINQDLDRPVPAPPNRDNFLGTDDRGRDVLARLIYGFRLSVLFGAVLTAVGTLLGIVAGALQGYFVGRFDLIFQRFIELWGSMPELYLLIIFASIFKPSMLLLLILLSMFGWMGLSDYVRAEFLKGRNMEYVKAAKALGVGNGTIMYRHLLPNSMTPVITFLPFPHVRGNSGPDQSRFSWPWGPAFHAKPRGVAGSGQVQYRGMVAFALYLRGPRRHPGSAHFYRRGPA